MPSPALSGVPFAAGNLRRTRQSSIVFGKLFECTFTGSMYGAGPTVFAVWAYVVAHVRNSGVELNPQYLAHVIGAPTGDIERAIEALCAPDPRSRTPDEEGRRLVWEGGFLYRVVNHSKYLNMLNEQDRRTYFREQKRVQRARLPKSPRVSKTVQDKPHLSSMSTHPEAEADPKKKRATHVVPPTKPADPRVKEFLTWFQAEYRLRRHGADYFVKWDKHGALIKQLLGATELPRLKRLAQVLLTEKTDEDFIVQTDRGIEILALKFNWLSDRLAAWDATQTRKSAN